MPIIDEDFPPAVRCKPGWDIGAKNEGPDPTMKPVCKTICEEPTLGLGFESEGISLERRGSSLYRMTAEDGASAIASAAEISKHQQGDVKLCALQPKGKAVTLESTRKASRATVSST